MYTTNVPGLLIDREAMDLAFAVARGVEQLLIGTACLQAKAAEKRVVGLSDIETAGRAVAVDLIALIESARAGLHAREEAPRAA